ncbi:uncharacterized protein LOC113350753 [Papaver somniferum]|uniref:uncharacterized protein LOC113350753 n=1 Tax=Papaver somniferum TaxID=3469 RepID=UPI000E703932|nr:uncharacterized protein LOC113350753 [Papaver somniferum]
MLVLLLYVDDIILTGNSLTLMSTLISALKKVIAMQELGYLNYFLGIEAIIHEDYLVFSEKKYTLELLENAQMLDCKPCDTLISITHRDSIHDGKLLGNPLEYRTIVGSLQYLTHTRPGICFGVNYIIQFMYAPTDIHIMLVKRILRYLKGSIALGLTITAGDMSFLTTYTDSDWAGCAETRRTTSGYAIFLGSSLIPWSSKRQSTISQSSAVLSINVLLLLHQNLNGEEKLADLFTKGMFSYLLQASSSIAGD